MIRQAAILVGGRGTRLGALSAATPKPLQEVGGRPFLAWLLRELCRYDIQETLLLAGHLADRVADAAPRLAAGLPKPMALRVVRERAPAGTGGALAQARPLLDARFLLCNGDSVMAASLAGLLADAAQDGPSVLVRLLLRRMDAAGRYGVVACAGDRVLAFQDRPEGAGPATISAGVAVMARAALDGAPDAGSLERDVLPRLAAAGAVRGTPADGWFVDIGVPDDLARARAELPAVLRRPALLLDRDGVINVDHGYVGTRARWDYVPGALDAIRRAGAAGWQVFVVTNQSGVARGLFTQAEMDALHDLLLADVRAAGGNIDDLRACPFHPEASVPALRADHPWRKPAPGMILDLIRAWDLDPARCLLVGDKDTDLQAAARAGIAGRLFPGGDLDAFLRPLLRGP